MGTTSTTVVTTAATVKEWFTKPATQRPKRTTWAMPTEENPLLRFYPVEDVEETNEIPPEMMSDQGVFGSKHSERSSPIFSEFSESASNGNQIILSQITAVLSMGICAGFIFFLRL